MVEYRSNDLESLRIQCISLFKGLASVPGSSFTLKDVTEFINRINNITDINYLKETIEEIKKDTDEAIKSNSESQLLAKSASEK